MTLPLQKAPKGFLGALDLKTLGRNPDKFADELRGVIDVTPFYYADLIAQSTNASAGEVAPASVLLEVDAQHLWLMRGVSGRVTYAVNSNSADEQWRHTLQYLPGNSGAPQFYLATETLLTSSLALPLGAAATFSVFLHREWEHGFLLMPGSFLQLSSSATMSAGSYTLDLRVDVIAIPL